MKTENSGRVGVLKLQKVPGTYCRQVQPTTFLSNS